VRFLFLSPPPSLHILFLLSLRSANLQQTHNKHTHTHTHTHPNTLNFSPALHWPDIFIALQPSFLRQYVALKSYLVSNLLRDTRITYNLISSTILRNEQVGLYTVNKMFLFLANNELRFHSLQHRQREE
jgi:hypothetical protein